MKAFCRAIGTPTQLGSLVLFHLRLLPVPMSSENSSGAPPKRMPARETVVWTNHKPAISEIVPMGASAGSRPLQTVRAHTVPGTQRAREQATSRYACMTAKRVKGMHSGSLVEKGFRVSPGPQTPDGRFGVASACLFLQTERECSTSTNPCSLWDASPSDPRILQLHTDRPRDAYRLVTRFVCVCRPFGAAKAPHAVYFVSLASLVTPTHTLRAGVKKLARRLGLGREDRRRPRDRKTAVCCSLV